MAKCSSCGLEVDETLENCPNCGNDLLNSEEPNENSSVEKIECSNCGAELDKSLSFCPSCGSKVEKEDDVLRCKECGSELPENTLFCSVCGAKVDAIKKESAKTCPIVELRWQRIPLSVRNAEPMFSLVKKTAFRCPNRVSHSQTN